MIAPLTVVLEDGSAWSFDAVARIAWDRRVAVTEHPLEAGGSVSDHAQRLPVVSWKGAEAHQRQRDRESGAFHHLVRS